MVCKFACPFSTISEVNFIATPAVMLEVIQPTIPDRDKDVKVAITKVGNHVKSCCDVGCTGAAGITTTNLTNTVTNPVSIPAAKNGIKYCKRFREYKLKVCDNISPMESSLWRFLFSNNLSSVVVMQFRA